MTQPDQMSGNDYTQPKSIHMEGRSWVRHILRVFTLNAQHDHLLAEQELLSADYRLWQLAGSHPWLSRDFIAGAAEEFDLLVEKGRRERSAPDPQHPMFSQPRILVLPASGLQARGRSWFLNCFHALEAVAKNDDSAANERLVYAAALLDELRTRSDPAADEAFMTGAAKEAEEGLGELRITCKQHPVRHGWWTGR